MASSFFCQNAAARQNDLEIVWHMRRIWGDVSAHYLGMLGESIEGHCLGMLP
jgi:hypothetical protein